MSSPMPSDLGARVPAATEMEDAAAGGGDGVLTTPPPPPTCPVCMDPWTCNGDHRICCIPCGHVYGRSCLERWLHRSGNDVAKCPLCGKQFEHNLITNLYAPGNLWDGCCRLQELKAHHQSEIHEMARRLTFAAAKYKAASVSANEKWMENLFEEVSLVNAEWKGKYVKLLAEFHDKSRAERESLRAGLEQSLDQIVRMCNEEKTMADSDLKAMKERMKKMAEEENATATELMAFMELNFPQLSLIPNPFVVASVSAPAPVSSEKNATLRRNPTDQPVPAPPVPADAANKRRRRGT